MQNVALPHTMPAAVLHGRRDLRFERVPTPAPGPGEVLLEVTAVGLCGTDAAEWSTGAGQIPLTTPHPVTGHVGPMVVGHEFAGRVVGVGEGVDEGLLGSLLASCGAAPCGTCEHCLGGRSNVCRRYSSVGLHRNGALARYVATPLASCVEVGSLGIDEHEAALVQPMAIAVHSAHRSGVRAGDIAIVQGIGGIGAFLIHVLVTMGVHVVAVDLDQSRLAIARELGAHETIVGGTETAVAEITASFGERIPIFFEVSGSPRGVALAIEIVPMGTTIVLVGIAKQKYEVDLGRVTVRELLLVGTNAMVRETDLSEAARLVSLRAGKWGLIASAPIAFERLVDDGILPISEGRPPAVKTLVAPPAGE